MTPLITIAAVFVSLSVASGRIFAQANGELWLLRTPTGTILLLLHNGSIPYIDRVLCNKITFDYVLVEQTKNFIPKSTKVNNCVWYNVSRTVECIAKKK